MRSCSPTIPTNSNPHKQEIKIDTFWVKGKDSIVYKPKPYKVVEHDTVIREVDTLAILRDYFAKVHYQDTIKIDTFGYVIIKDIISKNRIEERNTVLNYKFPIIKETIHDVTVIPPRRQLYIGFDIGGNKNELINYFGPQLTFKNKKDHLYNLGAGLSTGGGINYRFGTSWKIKLKKDN